MLVPRYPAWRPDSALLDAVREFVVYAPGDDRATGQLYAEGEQPWPESVASAGEQLLAALEHEFGTRFTICIFQAYRNGAGCDWHADTPFDEQAVLSLGATRTFGVRHIDDPVPGWLSVSHGDLVYMSSGFQQRFQHCVPVEDVKEERVSLVFRTVAR